MIARMRKLSVNFDYPPTLLKLLTKLTFIVTSCLILATLSGCTTHFAGMLNPKGIIANEERKLFFDTLALMLIVVLPVIIMSFTFVYHYQISHRTKDYKPNWSHSYFLETLWWGIPCVIILILAIMTWKKTHDLDPYKRINGYNQPPLLIQVIALPWKWLFIYPEQHIATINYLEIPVGQPVEYWITTDNVPMSAFFIPQLGSQIYTMAGMRTRLHLLANDIGIYEGMNTQFNGDGFSDMTFAVHVVDAKEMQQWFSEVKNSVNVLTNDTYNELLKPSIANQPTFYSTVSANLFNDVIMIYMNSHGNIHPRNDLINSISAN